MRLHVPKGIVIPKHIIKEKIDEAHRRDWEDPDRYERQKAKALRYIPVRARELIDVDKLMREVSRVFHDDLIRDRDVRECAEREVYRNTTIESAILSVLDGGKSDARGEVRGVDDSDDTLADLEWQHDEEVKEP